MPKQIANERTFQGILLNIMSEIISETPSLGFKDLIQEPNEGVNENRFADLRLTSSKDGGNKTFFELKNVSWDATDEILVRDAATKSYNKGHNYFVTGTPRQLAIFKTYVPNTELIDRKLKIYTISNILKNDDVLTNTYKNELRVKLRVFLKDLSDIVHEVTEVKWDSFDKFFVNKLSSYILEASSNMFDVMFGRIQKENNFKIRLREYLKEQDIFNVSLLFERKDIYNICQLANYLLYLKIIFYSYLQRDVKELNLKKLKIPDDKDKLNFELRKRFNDVLEHDFQMIFEQTVLDEFEFPNEYIPELRRNVETISKLEFKSIDCDIIGAIYNTLIDNQEQHDRGQHFTNTNEVDIVNAFCITKDTNLILDSGCGAGTFLVRAYQLLKYYNKKITHEELLEKLWGIEIASFPAFLATMNLSLLNIKEFDNYPLIIRDDFSDVTKNYILENRLFLNKSHTVKAEPIDRIHYTLELPIFDVCVGNPPYIRQELIEDKDKWADLAHIDYGIKKINRQSDLYVYYLMHTASLLKENGRLGYVISASWLDVNFGTGFQKFLLDNFKIIAVIDNQVKRSFDTASINTVILILEKCKEKSKRENNITRFIRIYKDYNIIIEDSKGQERLQKVLKFASELESVTSFVENENYLIITRRQNQLENESFYDGKYENGNWGAKYLRSSPIFHKILDKAGEKLKPLRNFVEVKYGIKTGANDFFYLIDETYKVHDMTEDEYNLHFGNTRDKRKINWSKLGWYYSEMNERHYLLERFYFKPLFKSVKEANKLDVDIKQLRYSVLICNDNKEYLKKFNSNLLKYINEGEKHGYQKRPTVSQNISIQNKTDWFNLAGGTEISVGDFIYPAKVGEKYRLIDNRKASIYCDKVNYNITVSQKYTAYSNIIFLILNSTLFRYFVDLFARQLTGSQTLSDIDVNVVNRTLIINPELLLSKSKELDKIYDSFKNREQGTIFEEINKEDRQKLDWIILETLGLNKSDLKELYKEAVSYIQERKDKSKSVVKTKSKQKLSYTETLKLLAERYPDISKYPDLISDLDVKQVTIPNLKGQYPKDITQDVGGMFGGYHVLFKDHEYRKTKIQIDSLSQLKLFYFLNEKLEMRGTKIEIPINEMDCNEVLITLEMDFNKNMPQITSWLKSIRNKHNPIGIYRDLVMELTN